MPTRLPALKVRPRALAQASPCAAELTAMLQCWAQTSAASGSEACAASARALEQCMAQSAGRRGKIRKPTINYHLARLGKNL